MTTNVPIGQLLVESGFITPTQLEKALVKQKETPGLKIGDMLLSLGYVSETQLVHALSTRLKVAFVDLSTSKIDVDAVKKIPETTAKRFNVIAYKQANGRLYVATNDPINFSIFEELKISTGMEIHPMLATKSSILETISKAYSASEQEEVMSDINKEYDANAELAKAQEDASASDDRVDSAPVVKLVNTLVESAFHSNASDIHIEPFKDRTRIRFRIDGECIEKMQVKPAVHNSLVTRIKILGGMNIAEKRIPLDGRFGTQIDGVNLDLRVSSVPAVYGEKVVIRLLSTADEKTRGVKELGMTEHNYEMFKQIIRCPHGVMLVTGPTGSGKSTTLYATLGELSKPNVNVVTCEDPVEKKIDGVNQCQMNVKAGYTFALALRAILRQDPDIVMVGEIRDGETADIAIRAAITGHLVLSTLHTNDAAGTILRLVDMGVAPYMVASSLVGVIAQRLVKVLCVDCAEETVLSDPADLRLVNKTSPVKIKSAKAGGCRSCRQTGYKGRTAIHEIIIPSNAIKECISKNGTAEEIGELAKKNGTRLLRDNVTEMVLAGKTTMDELVKATYSV
ncbi:MAG: Flp pilus assembly complex ATPase component TadA [Oscillospiraceae bacterium]|jgi:type IV pilus assembly protein PilB|nr:Flp pilus assembly complex ATPase component TadA [Oscillospiraceae bacterium]